MFRSITALLAGSLLSTTAVAQTYEDLDGSAQAKKVQRDEVVKEIHRGTYAKANVGAGFYLGQFSQTVSPGTSIGMSFGGDFLDQKTLSMAWKSHYSRASTTVQVLKSKPRTVAHSRATASKEI